jgi:DNA-binding MarR family transcriptional regulator
VTDEEELEAHLRLALSTWPQIDPTVEAIVARVAKINKLIEQAADVNLRAAGLTREEYKVLCSLHLGTKSHGALCRELGTSTGTMTNRLDKLERSGLVTRAADPNDRRGVLLTLTAGGESRLDDYVDRGAERERKMLAGLAKKDKEALLALLRKAHAAIERELPH